MTIPEGSLSGAALLSTQFPRLPWTLGMAIIHPVDSLFPKLAKIIFSGLGPKTPDTDKWKRDFESPQGEGTL